MNYWAIEFRIELKRCPVFSQGNTAGRNDGTYEEKSALEREREKARTLYRGKVYPLLLDGGKTSDSILVLRFEEELAGYI